MSAGPTRSASLRATLRKLEHELLLHLLEHVEELRTELDNVTAARDALVQECERAHDRAESWREDVLRLTEEITDAGGTVGLQVDGAVRVMSQPGAKGQPS